MPNYQLPMDLTTQQQQLQRKQELVNFLTQRAMTPQQGQMVSGHYVSPGIAGNLTQLATAMMGKYQQNKLDEGQKQLSTNYQQAITSALDQYQKDFQTDPRGAASTAAASQIPMLQKIGLEDMKGLATQKDVLNMPGASVESRANSAMGGGLAALKEAPKIMDVNGQVVSATPEGAQAIGDYRDKFGAVEPIATDRNGNPIIGQKNLSGGKADYAPGGGVTVNTGETDPFSKAWMGKIADLGEKLTTQAQGAAAVKNGISQLRQLAPNMYTGAGANYLTIGTNIAKALGVPVDQAKLANSQTAQKAISDMVLQSMTQMGARSVTDQDRAVMEKALPNIGTDPQALQMVMEMLDRKSDEQLGRYKDFRERASGVVNNPMAGFDFAPEEVAPVPAATGQGSAQTVPAAGGAHFVFNPATGKLEAK